MTKNRSFLGFLISLFVWAVLIFAAYQGYQLYNRLVLEKEVLKRIIDRLQADTRIAEVMVTDVKPDPQTGKVLTTIKFLEYDSRGIPLAPKYFTFNGNIIQFQSLVVRFDDFYVQQGDALRGKSAYIFWKAFVLNGKDTQEFEINNFERIPQGYKVEGPATDFERKFWMKFWRFALDPQYAQSSGVKNAQIEAPGTRFVPGLIYTLKIEHDGGIRIDSSPIPQILQGEKVIN